MIDTLHHPQIRKLEHQVFLAEFWEIDGGFGFVAQAGNFDYAAFA